MRYVVEYRTPRPGYPWCEDKTFEDLDEAKRYAIPLSISDMEFEHRIVSEEVVVTYPAVIKAVAKQVAKDVSK